MERTEELHRLLLNDSGERPRELTTVQRQQALVLHLACSLRQVASPWLTVALSNACVDALKKVGEHLHGSVHVMCRYVPSCRAACYSKPMHRLPQCSVVSPLQRQSF